MNRYVNIGLAFGMSAFLGAAGHLSAQAKPETAKPATQKPQTAIDGRTTRHAAYAASQRKRKLIEEASGWAKTIAGLAKMKVRGLARVRHSFTLTMTAYNLIRMPKLLGWAAA